MSHLTEVTRQLGYGYDKGLYDLTFFELSVEALNPKSTTVQ